MDLTQSLRRNVPLGPQDIVVDFNPDCVTYLPDNEIQITFAKNSRYGNDGGSRWHSRRRFRHGYFEAWIKCPPGDTAGLCFTFYLSSGQGQKSQDEIDFEFLGNKKSIVQTNYFANGHGGNEMKHKLGFDCSSGYHKYSFRWEKRFVAWLVDDKVVRRVQRKAGMRFPEKSMCLYGSVWNASKHGRWAGIYVGDDEPYLCFYKDVKVSGTGVEVGEHVLMRMCCCRDPSMVWMVSC